MSNKNYWERRSEGGRTRLRERVSRWIKSDPTLLSIASIMLSSRLADEAFLRERLRRYRPAAVLDLACGGGKPVLPANCPVVFGVDIEGFPADDALARGYTHVTTYAAPEYSFSLPTPVDLVTCINLNAHIPFGSYENIIRQSLIHLRNEGHLLLVNEHDNAGLSYGRFKDPKKKERLVTGMEHHHFGTKQEFLAKFQPAFPELELVEQRSLVAIVTMNQHFIYSSSREPGHGIAKLIFAGDLLLGPINTLYTRLSPACESFLVGFVFKKAAA